MLSLIPLMLTLLWALCPITVLAAQEGGGLNTPITAPEGLVPANITWIGNLTENGPNVTLTGRSLDEILVQLNAAAPDLALPEPAVEHTYSRIEQRSEYRLICDELDFPVANYNDALSAIVQLTNMPGFCIAEPMAAGQPPKCNRFACSGRSAIFICNYNEDHQAIATCARLGKYAEKIANFCYDTKQSTKGELFDGDNWSVMIHDDAC
ncbi:hypothetical protein F4777DRAFT_573887 [Nemania sp. FL0916]|nr:hypothetical protein F4777DRAFT_573887 [Nemania sp. FL0916]